MAVPEQRLADLAAAAAVLIRQNEPGVQSVGQCLAAWLNGPGDQSLEEAFCIDVLPGERKPQTIRRLAERDRLIVETVSRFFPGRGGPGAFAQALKRYRDGPGWRQAKAESEISYVNTARGTFWSILKVSDAELSERRVQEIVRAASSTYSSRER